jgi:integrase
MATPRVTLKSKSSARGPRTFYLDYRVNGKRIRPHIIRSLFKFAVESEYLARNPASKLEMLRIASTGRPDFYTDDELQAIWKNVDGQWVDALKFTSLTGLRKAELINLHWENLDFTKGAEHILLIRVQSS